MKHHKRITTLAAIAASYALAFCGSAAYAHGGPPGGVSGGRPAGIPGGMPQGIHPNGPPSSINPNSGVPATTPATGRGQSGTAPGRTASSTHSKPVVGKVASFSGTTLTLTLPTGVTKTFTVDAHAFGQLKPEPGTPVAVASEDGTNADSIVPANQAIQGTVSAVTRNSVTMTLPNGNTVTVVVPAQAAAHVPLKPGSQAILISHDGGFSADEFFPVIATNGTRTNRGNAAPKPTPHP